MKVAGEYTFDLPIDQVWAGIFDTQVLAASLPGCENLERNGDVMSGELVVKVGPVRGKFKGTVEFSDIEAPNRCSFAIQAKGSTGFVKATATLELEDSDGRTILRYDSDSKIGGRIASLGQRLLGASARAIAKQSLQSLGDTLSSLHAGDAATAAGGEPASAEEHEGGIEEEANRQPQVKPKSQRAFAAGVAQEVAKDLVPPWLRIVLAIVALSLITWLIYALAT